MKFKSGAIAVLTLATSICVPNLLAQGPPPPGYHNAWDVPPSEYQEAGQRGYHDGIEGAHKDYENRRRPDVNNRDEYRHPHVSGRDRDTYRDAFRAGYERGMEHLMHDHRY
jgi:hypothetical protein